MDTRSYADKRMEEAPMGHTEGYAKLSSLKKVSILPKEMRCPERYNDD